MSQPSLVDNVRSASGTRRFLILGGAVLAMITIWMLARWASAPTYVSLFRNLELGEVPTVESALTKAGITHRLAEGGTTVEVDAGELARARVAIASSGLPSNGRPGLELFDKPSWGMTDFTQRVTYQRALEGELARTIGGIQGIERAQVHLVLPTSSPIRRLERGAAASVVLTLNSNGVSPETVQGITYIVSNSVEQLSADNVAVMDDRGHVLTVPGTAGSATGLTTRQLDVQSSVERRLTTKIEDLLATVVGAGGARAQVTAHLDFNQVDRTTESFNPDGQVLQTEQRSEGGDDGTILSPTIVSNTYQNSRQVEKVISSVGGISQLSVAVLVDQRSLAPRNGAPAPPGIDSLERLVRNAVGADSARGDRISVMAVPFESPLALAAGGDSASLVAADGAPGPDLMQMVQRVGPTAVAVLAMLGIILLAWKALKGAPMVAATESRTLALNRSESRADLPASTAPRLEPAMADRPESAARIVRSWLAES